MTEEANANSDTYKLARFTTITHAVTSILNNFLKWSGLVLIVYFSYRTIDSLAGKETVANIIVKIMTDFKANNFFAYLVGGAGAGYGLLERRSKITTIERLQGRKRELEERLDPRRKSSQLTTRGETRPEDRS